MNNCRWSFEGPAGNTLEFMRAIYHHLGTAGRQIVETTFENIRRLPDSWRTIALKAVSGYNAAAVGARAAACAPVFSGVGFQRMEHRACGSSKSGGDRPGG